ncbi:MAG: RluA family pseudouridine synthase [Deltaproteobacteria bacterium]|nr:RluA family pseudouridine synthase [Deltaproteobacteria bacterium]
MSKNNKIVANVPGIRLDAFLGQSLADISRQDVKKLCASGNVLINSKIARPGTILKMDDVIELIDSPQTLSQGDLPTLSIVYEDEFLIVSLKPRAIHSVSQKFQQEPSFADALIAYCPQCKSAGKDPLEGGLVQRLDYYTSGLIIAAKDKNTWYALHEDFLAHKIKKEYLALVEGAPSPEHGAIDTFLNLGTNFVTVETSEKPNLVRAKTDYRVLVTMRNEANDYSVICASTEFGKRHQIRAHLAYLGHPLVGDELYGSKLSLSNFHSIKHSDNGFLLHANLIELKHPHTKIRLFFEDMSLEFRDLLKEEG